MARFELFIIFTRLVQKFSFVASPNHPRPKEERHEGYLSSPPVPFHAVARPRRLREYFV